MWSFVTYVTLHVFSKYTYGVACVSTLFLVFYCQIISRCGYTSFNLSVHQLMDIWVVSTFWPLCISAAVSMRVQFICVDIHLFPFGVYLGVELLGHMITLCLTFEELPDCFPR